MRKHRVRGRWTKGETPPILRVVAPLWLRIFCVVVMLPFLAFFVTLILAWARRGFAPLELFQVSLALVVIASGGYLLPIVLSSYVASEAGVERARVLGTRQRFAWSEIVEVRDSRFPLRLPRDVAYIVSRTGETMAVAKSMPRYRELLQLIEARASNLATRPFAPAIESRTNSWKSLGIAAASAVALYLVAKVLYTLWGR